MKNLTTKIFEEAETFTTGENFKIDEFTFEKIAKKSFIQGALFSKVEMLKLPNSYLAWLLKKNKIKPETNLTFGDFEDFLKENPL